MDYVVVYGGLALFVGWCIYRGVRSWRTVIRARRLQERSPRFFAHIMGCPDCRDLEGPCAFAKAILADEMHEQAAG